jgi:hypothetical protein
MKLNRIITGTAVLLVLLPCVSLSQEETGVAMLSMEASSTPEQEPKVTAVYGVSADDYLPSAQSSAKKHLRPSVRSKKTRPAFALPDAFYFIGGPIFLFLFLRVLVIFLNGFEEKRREELRTAAREVWDTD